MMDRGILFVSVFGILFVYQTKGEIIRGYLISVTSSLLMETNYNTWHRMKHVYALSILRKTIEGYQNSFDYIYLYKINLILTFMHE